MTITTAQREQWKSADRALRAINDEREALLEPTRERHAAAMEALGAAGGAIGEPIATCEGCGEPIFDGDAYLGGDTPLCIVCSPTFGDLLESDVGFVDTDGEPLDAEARRALYEAHIAGGGSPDDTMATP